jgi:hypothetical protein
MTPLSSYNYSGEAHETAPLAPHHRVGVVRNAVDNIARVLANKEEVVTPTIANEAPDVVASDSMSEVANAGVPEVIRLEANNSATDEALTTEELRGMLNVNEPYARAA